MHQMSIIVMLRKIQSWADIVAQQVKPPIAMPASHIRASVCILVALFSIQLPANVPGKAEEDNPSA